MNPRTLAVAGLIAAVTAVAAGDAGAARKRARNPAPAAEPAAAAEPQPWTVAVSSDPPFVMRGTDGNWTGIAVELWQTLCRELGIPFRMVELEGEALSQGIVDGEVDVVLAALVDPGVEEVLDLTHAYHSTGLGIAVRPAHGSGGIGASLRKLASGDFLAVVGALLLVILSVGVLMWLAERRRNHSEFGGKMHEGVWHGTWWAAVTMTTVGYGDKSPRTLPGRMIGLVWMFAAILIISSFTARISASLTVGELAHAVNGPEDLGRVRVGVVETAEYDTPSAYLSRRGVSYVTFPTAEAALEALADNRIDAAVYERPTLQYYVAKQHSGELEVLDATFENHGYAFALRDRRELLEPINMALLHQTVSDDWRAKVARYLRP